MLCYCVCGSCISLAHLTSYVTQLKTTLNAHIVLCRVLVRDVIIQLSSTEEK
jgi:hypothetical protein